MNHLSKLLNFVKLTNDFKNIERDIPQSVGFKRENDVEHSYQLARVSWYLANINSTNFDAGKILKYAPVHDLPEVYVGDTPLYAANQEHLNNKEDRKISKNLIKAVVSSDDYSLDEYYDNLIFLESKNILTFGDTNFRVFEKFFAQEAYDPTPLDLCLDDDKSIGLEMPKTWYLNKGKHALSIATYYNYLNWHGIVENKNLSLIPNRSKPFLYLFSS